MSEGEEEAQCTKEVRVASDGEEEKILNGMKI